MTQAQRSPAPPDQPSAGQGRDGLRLLHEAVENLADGLSVLEAIREENGRITDFRVAFANAAGSVLVGRPNVDAARGTLPGSWPDLRGSQYFDRLVDVVETGEPLALDDVTYAQETLGEERRYDIRITRVGDGLVAIWRDVTERYRAQQDLGASESRFRQFVETAPDATVVVDEGGEIALVNVQAERLFGYSRDEMVGRPVEMLVPEPLRAAHAEHRGGFARDMVRRELQTVPGLHALTKDGREVPVDISLSPLETERGLLVTASVRDVSEQRRAERQLAMLAGSNEALVHAEDEAALLWQICEIATTVGGYRLAWVGAAVEQGKAVRPIAQTGYERGYLDRANITWADTPRGRGPTGRAVRSRTAQVSRDILHDPAMVPWRADALARGYQSSVALPFVVDSQVLVFHAYADRPDAFDEAEMSTLQQMAGNLAVGIGSLRSRRQREQAEEALRRSEALLNEAQRITHVGGWEYAVADAGVTWTDEVYRIYGVSADSYDPADVDQDIAFYAPEDQETVAAAFRRAVEAGEPYDLELELVTAQGEHKWVRTIGRAEQSDGRVQRVFGNIMDITERKRAELQIADAHEALTRLNAELEDRVQARTRALQARTTELSEANERLRQANRELEGFSYTVSHDLRAPLRAMSGFSEILLEDYGPKLDEEGRRLVGIVIENAQRLGQLIDDLLTFSRIGRREMQTEPVDMTWIARAVAADLCTQEPDRDIDVQVDDLAPAVGDPSLLTQVWTNLLSNAVKFTAARDKARIRVSSERTDGTVVYRVADNGIGFEMEYADKLFGVFQRLHRSDQYPGTGVGLAIVERIVSRHGGQVWADSSPDAGATFSFTVAAG